MEGSEAKELRIRIGRAIRRLRDEEKVSAQYIARILDVSQSTVSRIESGALSIPAESLCMLAGSFNRPLSFFVGAQSDVVYDNEDVLRAGLVWFGASQLKAKKSIAAGSHWRTYAEFLEEVLTSIVDPRVAAAVAATLYVQSSNNRLNVTRILATIQNGRLAANLVGLITLIENGSDEINDLRRTRGQVLRRLGDLKREMVTEHGAVNSVAALTGVSPSYVARFINESLGNE